MNNIFIPLLNKSKISAVQSIDTNGNVLPEGLALLIFSLSHRAQVSIILKPQVDKGKIPQLESVKWSAKTIANNPKIRELTCLLAIADNISYSVIEKGNGVFQFIINNINASTNSGMQF